MPVPDSFPNTGEAGGAGQGDLTAAARETASSFDRQEV